MTFYYDCRERRYDRASDINCVIDKFNELTANVSYDNSMECSNCPFCHIDIDRDKLNEAMCSDDIYIDGCLNQIYSVLIQNKIKNRAEIVKKIINVNTSSSFVVCSKKNISALLSVIKNCCCHKALELDIE